MKEKQRVALFDLFRKKVDKELAADFLEATNPPTIKEEGEEMSAKKPKLGGKMQIRLVKPITFTQKEVFIRFMGGYNIVMHGIAGTGKTYIALYLALKELEKFQLHYDKVIIIRSVVPTRDMGYLPGSVKEKAAVYEAPYEKIINTLYERGDAYSILKSKGMLEFVTTSFLRGMTLERAIVVVDEIQNMTYPELATVITRMGDNVKVIFAGDFRQTDFHRRAEKTGVQHFLNILNKMEEFSLHEFNPQDIVRSKIVRSFIMEEERYREEKYRSRSRANENGHNEEDDFYY